MLVPAQQVATSIITHGQSGAFLSTGAILHEMIWSGIAAAAVPLPSLPTSTLLCAEYRLALADEAADEGNVDCLLASQVAGIC